MLDLNEIINIHVGIKALWNPLVIKSFANLCFMVNIANSNRMNLLKSQINLIFSCRTYIYIYTRYNDINISENSLIITIYVNTSNLHFTILIEFCWNTFCIPKKDLKLSIHGLIFYFIK